MSLLKSFLILFILTFSFAPAPGKTSTTPARQLVVNLYRQHKQHSPFFQKTNRALVDRYFAKELAELIWKNAITSTPDEVGLRDGDPLFNAQDMEIRKFVVHAAQLQPEATAKSNRAKVVVTFQNFAQPHSLTFQVVLTSSGWRVSDIVYDDGSTLSGILKPATAP